MMKKKNVAFFVRHFTERETEVSTYNYAYYNEKILKNKSYIVHFTEKGQNKYKLPKMKDSYLKFASEFGTIEINDISEMKEVIENYKIDVFYTQTHGGKDIYEFENKEIWKNCKTIKHCVFNTLYSESDNYVTISNYLNKKFHTTCEVLPYIVPDLPESSENFRKALKIPEDAIVLGRHGGMKQFDIKLVHDAIKECVNDELSNIYFLFMNTEVFYEHEKIIYLEKTIDLLYKKKFINTCDGMIHGRSDGETFGLSIAEFSIMNKPIITCVCGDLEHILILKEKAIVYKSKEELRNIFENVKELFGKYEDWNCYKKYSAENVIEQFAEIMSDRIYPIGFSIPEEKIQAIVTPKVKLISSLIPGKVSTYIYETEKDYYEEYQKSMFAITKKKAGWDCMRHYEILANWCIPYFHQIEECPENTMYYYPKEIAKQGNAFLEKLIRENKRQVKDLTRSDLLTYNSILFQYINALKENLTTKKMVHKILRISNKTEVKRILYLSSHNKPDYLKDLTLHGFKMIYGKNCHDYPKIQYMYKSSPTELKNLYGKGMTYSKLLNDELHDSEEDAEVENNIFLHKYDLIVYGSIHRGIPLYENVMRTYAAHQVIFLCGEDEHKSSCIGKCWIVEIGYHSVYILYTFCIYYIYIYIYYFCIPKC